MNDPIAGASAIIPLYERTASAWLAARGTDLIEAEWLDLFTRRLPHDATILDLGCGGGAPIGSELLRRGFTITSVDSSASLIRHAHMTLPNGTWLVDDMRRFDPPDRFDGIIAWHSFFHLGSDDQRAMIPRLAGLVRLGGSIMFTSGLKAGEAWGERQGEPLFHASLAPEEYRDLLGTAGFEAIEFINADPIAFIWLATRKKTRMTDTAAFHIITGGPGSGKTTLIDALATQGIRHMPEAGRAIIRDQVAIGGTALPWADRAAFAEMMLGWELRSWHEAGALPGPVIFDRGVPDVIGYLRLCGLPVPDHVLKAVGTFRYAPRVFVAPPWREIFAADAERRQDYAEAEATHAAMIETYTGLGYELVPLPLSPVAERVRFVRGNIGMKEDG